MPAGGKRDLVKERRWREVFVDWKASGLTGAEYCRRRRVEYSQFADWLKRVRRRDAQAARSAAERRSVGGRRQPEMRAHEKGRKQQVECLAEDTETCAFVPVRLAEHSQEEPKDRVTNLEVILRNGVVLRFNGECSLAFLSSFIPLLESQ